MGITAIQSAAWIALVYWNAGGEYADLPNAVEMVGAETWPAIPAFFITSAMILVVIQKVGGMVLTFVDKHRKRIEKERAEAGAEARAEAYAEWTEWNRRRVEAEKRGERFDEPPPSLNGR